MKCKKNKLIAWNRIIVALIFLFNPNIGIVDILPDFIGYILLCTAVSRVAAIDDRIGEAHTLLVRLIYITIIRFASLFVTFGIIPLTDQAMSILLFSFVFDVLELITLIPSMLKLFDGILYLSDRHGGEAAYIRAGKYSRKTVTEKARNSAIFFACAKAFCGTLPEFSSLSGQGWDESVWGRLHQFTGMFRVIGVAFSLVFGIIFIVRMIKYVSLMKKDTDFEEQIEAVYENTVLSKSDYLARRAVMVAFGYFGAAAVLTLDFNLDSYNIIPDVLSALCMVAALLTIRKYITNWKVPAILSGIYGFVSLYGTIAEYVFASQYFIEAVDVDPETYNFYVVVCILSVSSIMFVLSVIFVMRYTMSEIIDKHTGFSMTTNDTYDPAEKVKQLHIMLKRRLVLLIVFAALSALLSIAAKILVTVVGFLWMFVMVIDVIYAVFTFKLLGEIKEQIDYKYMLS